MAGGSFFGSIASGTLLGYFADRWLDTAPWLVVIGAALGAYSGFMRLMTMSNPTTTAHGHRGGSGERGGGVRPWIEFPVVNP